MHDTINGVADIVQVTGDGGELRLALVVAELMQDAASVFGDQADVPFAVLGVTNHGQGLV